MNHTAVHRALARPAAALVAIGVLALLPATPAHAVPAAAPVTTCAWETTHTAISGDLRVAAGTRCNLTRVAVRGDVIVEEGATLNLTSSVVKGDITAGEAAQVWLYWASVWGGIRADDATFIRLFDSTVFRSIRGEVSAMYTFRAKVRGAVNLAAGPVRGGYGDGMTFLLTGSFGGWVNLHGGGADIAGATLGRGLTVSASQLSICRTSIAGDVTVRWSHNPTEIGAAFGHTNACVYAPVTIGGSVHLYDNPHSILVAGTVIHGDLVCTGNTGPKGIVTSEATVHGERVGQCA